MVLEKEGFVNWVVGGDGVDIVGVLVGGKCSLDVDVVE